MDRRQRRYLGWLLLLVIGAVLFYAQNTSGVSLNDSNSNATMISQLADANHLEADQELTSHRWAIFILCVTLVICLSVTYALLRLKFLYLPSSLATILIGMLLGGMTRLSGRSVRDVIVFDPENFFLFLLPPIIFEQGYTVNKSDFFENIGTIHLFAVFGTIISALSMGALIFLGGLLPVIGYQLPLVEAMMLGSLLSAVDPVATLAIFHTIDDMDRTLYALVFGESVLNDAIAIVCFRAFRYFHTSHQATSGALLLLYVCLNFLLVFFGSLGIGVACALVSAAFFRCIDFQIYSWLEVALVALFAYLPYVLAEGIGLSGIMSILVGGIVMSHYTYFNLSPLGQQTTRELFKALAILSETFVFLYLGISVICVHHVILPWQITCTFLACMIGRALNIFPLSLMANGCRHKRISGKSQFILWFSGMRGAIAFALALHWKAAANSANAHALDGIMTTTLFVVILSIFVFGGGTLPLFRCLRRHDRPSLNEDPSVIDEETLLAKETTEAVEAVEAISEPVTANPSWFTRWDEKLILPWLRRPSPTMEAPIVLPSGMEEMEVTDVNEQHVPSGSADLSDMTAQIKE